jgi:hypothetical protein
MIGIVLDLLLREVKVFDLSLFNGESVLVLIISKYSILDF